MVEETSTNSGNAERCRALQDNVPWDFDIWTRPRVREAIRKLANQEGWSLTAPRSIQRALRARFLIPVPAEPIRAAGMDAAIDAAYPQRRCTERIALGTFAGEAMEASKS